MKLIQIVQGKIERCAFRAGKPPHAQLPLWHGTPPHEPHYQAFVWDKTIVRYCTRCGETHYAMVGYGSNVTTWRRIEEK